MPSRVLLAKLFTTVSLIVGVGSVADDEAVLEEVVVRAEASVVPSQGGTGSIAVVDAEAIELTRANHVHELLVRVPGVWISRGSGHEHLTAIRSGVLTGAGACGEFLLLENGIPIRPAGFCNVNNLFEVNTEQATAVEVVRGPGSALFGGNALHGVINTVTPISAEDWRGSFEAGPYDYTQARLRGGGDGWNVSALSTSSGGYRDDTGYGQQKAYLGFSAKARDWSVMNTVSATVLNQETGGFVRGFRAYDSSARTSNPNPEAYRDAWSARATSVWRRTLTAGRSVTVTPYARRSSMAFLQHFLPGQPLEKNAQSSGGVALRFEGGETRRWTVGAVAELFEASLSERQDGPTQGSAFLVATRPAGTHYDFDLAGATLAAYGDVGVDLVPDVETRGERPGRAQQLRLRESPPGRQYPRRRHAVRFWRLPLYAPSGTGTTRIRMSRAAWASNGRQDPARWSTRSPDSASDRRRPRSYTACRAGRQSPIWIASACGRWKRAHADPWDRWTSMSPRTSKPPGT